MGCILVYWSLSLPTLCWALTTTVRHPVLAPLSHLSTSSLDTTYGARGMDLIPYVALAYSCIWTWLTRFFRHRDFWQEVPYILCNTTSHSCSALRTLHGVDTLLSDISSPPFRQRLLPDFVISAILLGFSLMQPSWPQAIRYQLLCYHHYYSLHSTHSCYQVISQYDALCTLFFA